MATAGSNDGQRERAGVAPDWVPMSVSELHAEAERRGMTGECVTDCKRACVDAYQRELGANIRRQQWQQAAVHWRDFAGRVVDANERLTRVNESHVTTITSLTAERDELREQVRVLREHRIAKAHAA